MQAAATPLAKPIPAVTCSQSPEIVFVVFLHGQSCACNKGAAKKTVVTTSKFGNVLVMEPDPRKRQWVFWDAVIVTEKANFRQYRSGGTFLGSEVTQIAVSSCADTRFERQSRPGKIRGSNIGIPQPTSAGLSRRLCLLAVLIPAGDGMRKTGLCVSEKRQDLRFR